MQNQSAESAEIAEVNVIPLADVCLVLVIIVMIFSPMALQSMIQVQAAQAIATKAKVAVNEKPLFVDVSLAGFTLNNNTVATEYELYRLLQKSLASKNDKTVLVSSQPNVKYENVVRVLDIVKQSGAVSLSLVPRKDSSTTPETSEIKG